MFQILWGGHLFSGVILLTRDPPALPCPHFGKSWELCNVCYLLLVFWQGWSPENYQKLVYRKANLSLKIAIAQKNFNGLQKLMYRCLSLLLYIQMYEILNDATKGYYFMLCPTRVLFLCCVQPEYSFDSPVYWIFMTIIEITFIAFFTASGIFLDLLSLHGDLRDKIFKTA